MGFIERRNGRYRARYRDPLGRQLSETFSRKLDAERFLREVQVDIERGRWLDPSGAQLTLQSWSKEFLSWRVASRRRPSRPIAATWTSTSSPALAPTGSVGSPQMK